MPNIKSIESRIVKKEYDALCERIRAALKHLVAAFEPLTDWHGRPEQSGAITLDGHEQRQNSLEQVLAFLRSFVPTNTHYLDGSYRITIETGAPKFEDLPEVLRNAITNKAISDFLQNVEDCASALGDLETQ